MVNGEELLDFTQALEELQISEAELQNLIARGELRAFRSGGTMKFRRPDIDGLKNERAAEPSILIPGGGASDGVSVPGSAGERVGTNGDASVTQIMREAGADTEQIEAMRMLREAESLIGGGGVATSPTGERPATDESMSVLGGSDIGDPHGSNPTRPHPAVEGGASAPAAGAEEIVFEDADLNILPLNTPEDGIEDAVFADDAGLGWPPEPPAPARTLRTPPPRPASTSVMQTYARVISDYLSEDDRIHLNSRGRNADIFEFVPNAIENTVDVLNERLGPLRGADTSGAYGVSGDGVFRSHRNPTDNYRPILVTFSENIDSLESAMPMWQNSFHPNQERVDRVNGILTKAKRMRDIYLKLTDCNDALERFNFDEYNRHLSGVDRLMVEAESRGDFTETSEYSKEKGIMGLEGKYKVSDMIWNLYQEGVLILSGATDDERISRLKDLRNTVLTREKVVLASEDDATCAISIGMASRYTDGVDFDFRQAARSDTIKNIFTDMNAARLYRNIERRGHEQEDLGEQLRQVMFHLADVQNNPTTPPEERENAGEVLTEMRTMERQLTELTTQNTELRGQVSTLVRTLGERGRPDREERQERRRRIQHQPGAFRRVLPYAAAAVLGGTILWAGNKYVYEPMFGESEPPAVVAAGDPGTGAAARDRGAGSAGRGTYSVTGVTNSTPTEENPFERNLRVYGAEIQDVGTTGRKRIVFRCGPEGVNEADAERQHRFVVLSPVVSESEAQRLVDNIDNSDGDGTGIVYLTDSRTAWGVPQMGELGPDGRIVYLSPANIFPGR